MQTRRVVLFLVAALTVMTAQAQNAEHFFNRSELMTFGSYYYPEQWPEQQWDRDLGNMAAMGFDFTHFAEFAWAAMEPEEGRYDFAWLDRSVALAEKHGLKVIMCTPTPTPPAWLTEKHPDVLIVNENGVTIHHGTRQHVSWSNDIYIEYVEKIVAELGRRYGNHPTVIGWQIDNEPGHYDAYDYSNNAQQKFRLWLKEKYGTIDALNKTWGAAFWSETYQTFDQVCIPVRTNPHAMLDFKRFSSDEAARFINLQCGVLRKYISPAQWITTNTMPHYAPVDPVPMDGLDFHSYTKYILSGSNMNHGKQGFRIGSVPQLGIPNDTYRNLKGDVYGVMELQPGQVNWGRLNPQPMPGAVRLWIYHVFAGGSKFVCNYRFRQPLRGSEQYHYGMMMTDGVTPSPGGTEYVQVIKEREVLRKNLDRKPVTPKRLADMRTAILHSQDSRWETIFQPQTVQWDQYGHMRKYYTELKLMGVPVDILCSEDVDYAQYPFIVVPAYQLLDDALVAKWEAYARQGGHLVVTCRTGQKDRDAAFWETPLSYPIYGLIGAEGLFFDHMPVDRWAHVEMDGERYSWNNWGDVVTPAEGTEVWGTYADQFYAGKAAVLHRKSGKGTVTYVGVDTDDHKLEKAVLRKLYTLHGKDIMDLPEGVAVEWRDGFWIALNYSSETQTIAVPSKAKILIGAPKLEPCDVLVWKE